MAGRRAALANRTATSSVPLDNATSVPDAPTEAPGDGLSPRWLVVAVWALGPAGVYWLASLAHAALVERSLGVDVAFGRSLGFWIGAIYLALPLWGFLPARPSGWYARRRAVLIVGAVGAIGLLAAAISGALWLPGHWIGSVGLPVVGSIVVLLIAATFTLWLASRHDRVGR